MTCIAGRGPHCQSDQSGQRGKTARGPQRSLGQPPAVPRAVSPSTLAIGGRA